MRKEIRSLSSRLAAVALVAIMMAGAAPAMATVIKDSENDALRAKFVSELKPLNTSATKLGRAMIAIEQEAQPTVAKAPAVKNDAGVKAQAAAATRKQIYIPPPKPVAVPKSSGSSGGSSSTKTSSSSGTAVKQSAAPSGSSELAQAKSILAGLIAKYPILSGTSVSIGSTPGGYQAVAYYTSGRIVINPNHTVSLSRILNHEIWHIIDWRDNGRIDWGENVPPK